MKVFLQRKRITKRKVKDVMDVYNKEERSEVMRRVKSKNTKPELIIRKILHKQGFRFRIHDKKLPGKPDIKLSRYKSVILVNGCFWHGHDKNCGYLVPKSNIEFWDAKIRRNKERDESNIKKLIEMGWNVYVVWECELKTKNIQRTAHDLVIKLRGNL